MTVDEASVLKKDQFVNKVGHTECVEFVRQTSEAPHSSTWKMGDQVIEKTPGSIPRGTVIATFDDRGRYPTDGKGKHAAVYLSHTKNSIDVLDQWNAQHRVARRTIRVQSINRSRSDLAQSFYIVE
jgi:cation diffusion facilitator CzcD-associated flavoprotein CzcO